MHRPSTIFAGLFVLFIAAAPMAAAQEDPMVGVVSVSSFDDLMQDAQLIGKATGQPGIGAMIDAQIAGMTGGKGLQGFDKTRPVVLVLKLGENQPYPIICVPVSDLNKLLGSLPLAEKAEDVGDGILKVTLAKPAFIKEQNDWAFVTERKEQLSSLPPNPQELVGKMP
ncbi:MAG: hypothetical protein N2C12_12655, partial [Planctomycetales bacterium]